MRPKSEIEYQQSSNCDCTTNIWYRASRSKWRALTTSSRKYRTNHCRSITVIYWRAHDCFLGCWRRWTAISRLAAWCRAQRLRPWSRASTRRCCSLQYISLQWMSSATSCSSAAVTSGSGAGARKDASTDTSRRPGSERTKRAAAHQQVRTSEIMSESFYDWNEMKIELIYSNV